MKEIPTRIFAGQLLGYHVGTRRSGTISLHAAWGKRHAASMSPPFVAT
jgi:hypothetical protein